MGRSQTGGRVGLHESTGRLSSSQSAVHVRRTSRRQQIGSERRADRLARRTAFVFVFVLCVETKVDRFVVRNAQMDLVGHFVVEQWRQNLGRCRFAMARKPTDRIRMYNWPIKKNGPYSAEITKRPVVAYLSSSSV